MTTRIVLLSVGALAVIGCAKGEPVGHIDLFAKDAALTVVAKPGDTLHFRTDTVVDMKDLKNVPRFPRGSKAKDALHRSQLTVVVRGGGAAAVSTTCPLKGNGAGEAMIENELSNSGTIVSCTVPITAAGPHVVTATVAWDPGIKPLSGKLEVRLAPAK